MLVAFALAATRPGFIDVECPDSRRRDVIACSAARTVAAFRGDRHAITNTLQLSDTASPTLRRPLCPSAMLAGIVAWLLPSHSPIVIRHAANGPVCYDLTHNLPFSCCKPPAQAAVSSPAPAASPANPVQRQVATGSRKAVAQYNPKELRHFDRRK